MSINERVINIYESLQIKQAEFARRINISPQTLNNQVKGKNGLSLATLALIARGYPSLNMRWLISGDGGMWLDNDYQEILNTDNLIMNEDPPQYGNEKDKSNPDMAELLKRIELLELQMKKQGKEIELIKLKKRKE